MTADELDPMPPLMVEEALRQAVAGDPIAGGMLLVPLIEKGHRSCYALCAMLATAAMIGAKPKPELGMFVMEVEDASTGEPAGPEELPPHFAFAFQFSTAWANDDQDTALALFDALCAERRTETGMTLIADSVLALYEMAVATSVARDEEQRDNPGHED